MDGRKDGRKEGRKKEKIKKGSKEGNEKERNKKGRKEERPGNVSEIICLTWKGQISLDHLANTIIQQKRRSFSRLFVFKINA